MRSIRYALLTITALVTGCALTNDPLGSSEAAVGPKPPASTPTISIIGATQTTLTVRVCAGSTGAPAGYSLHWLEEALLTGGVWPSSDTAGFCHASFSGNASESRFDLGPYECETVVVGDLKSEAGASWVCNTPIQCGTEYAFRGFAHGNSSLGRSEWATTVTAWTASCDEGCTYTQGYWKTHNIEATKPGLVSSWPCSSVDLGTVTYNETQLIQIFNTAVKGNGLVALAHQLAAAKLNIAGGASVPASVSGAIADADALIGGKVVPSVGWDWLDPTATSALVATLTQYNEGTIGPGHCEEAPTWSAPRTTSIPSPTPSTEKGFKAP